MILISSCNKEPSEETYQIIRKINRPGRMMQMGSLLNCQSTIPMQYGGGISLTTMETALLFYISGNPGVTNATLSRQFGRTKGAISQTVKKLEANGNVIREPNPKDAKSYNLYATAKGKEIIDTVNEYDMTNSNSLLQQMLAICPVSDVQVFFHMVDVFTALLIKQLDELKKDSPPEDDIF